MDSNTVGETQGSEAIPSTPSKKRKLKHPRTARACTFCRRRKVRCTGTQPCNYCNEEGVECKYGDGIPAPNAKPEGLATQASIRSADTHHDPVGLPIEQAVASESPNQASGLAGDRTNGAACQPKPATLRRHSLDPPEAFAEGRHMGPTAGLSFLYHTWNTSERQEREATLPTAPLISYGDMPSLQVLKPYDLPTHAEATSLLEQYFRFATPTYRFLHRPSTERWTAHLLDGKPLLMSETACVLLAFAQSLLYTRYGDRYGNGGDADLQRSIFYCERAKTLLNQESGPASISSVQARLALCLHLLSTFRINESRFAFSMACAILTSIGLHRRTRPRDKVDLTTLESGKRTFWCAYVLDGYLSVILGRPRILRDQDIDQVYPRNIDDQDLLSAEAPEDLPLHGNLEAFIAHAELAKLMGRNSDLLYPLQPLTEDQVLDRTTTMLDYLSRWKKNLPEFLKPREKTLTGQRTFERQNNVLKYAYSHLQILITRRCLLADFSNIGEKNAGITDERASGHIQQCADAINTILSTTHDMIERNALYQGYWFTPYIALVAISTLYVFVIQKCRSSQTGFFPQVEASLEKAKKCQEFLTTMSPRGSQTRRHFALLDRLRLRAEKDAARARLVQVKITTTYDSAGTNLNIQTSAVVSPQEHSSQSHGGSKSDLGYPVALDYSDDVLAGSYDAAASHYTPSEDDVVFQTLMKWDWESLDTVGFPADGDFLNFQA